MIVNARDAMPQGGKIILRTRNVMAAECAGFNETSVVPGDYVAIEVEDFGHGIPPEVKDKIFEPFFTTKDIGKGTGLGLAMVYGIVKQTGGYVFCSSTVGKGTVFTILLPHYIPDETLASRSIEQAAAPAADLTGHGTILLVEDEEAVRAFGARALASRGYTVLQAASGTEALQIVEQNSGQDRSCRFRRRHAGNGWPNHVRRIAQTRGQGQGHFRVWLCRGRLRQKPARRRGFRLFAETFQSEAIDRGGERQAVKLDN